MLHLALIASDNRAAHALGRTYPGGLERFVATMNRMARALGMHDTVYVEPTGLSSGNRSTALDLAKLADYAYQNYPEIRHISTTGHYTLGTQRVVVKKKRHQPKVYYRTVAFNNTNRLTRMDDWHIGLSKTGFINEAGHCLVMQAQVAQRDVIIVLLDATGHQPPRRRRRPHQGVAGIRQRVASRRQPLHPRLAHLISSRHRLSWA